MRILHVTTEFPPVIYGGLGTAVGGLVNASAESGNLTVAVLLVGGTLRFGDGVTYGSAGGCVPPRAGGIEPVSVENGVTFFQISPSQPVEDAVRIARAWHPDVLHLHTAWVWPFAEAIIEQVGVPLVYTIHSVDRAEYEIGHEPNHILAHSHDQEIAIARAVRMIALTENESDLVAQYYPEACSRIRIVGNGIEECALARSKADSCVVKTNPVVLYTGRLVERKGIRELLAAIPLVLERAPRTQFVLAGGPPYTDPDELARTWLPAECYAYRDNIRFTGWLSPSGVAEWYRRADIQVVPSRYEPFGMVVLEGMLHGLPIVAANVGGPARILKHEVTGLLYAAHDVEMLAAHITALALNPERRKCLGAAAATDVRNHWLWPAIIKKMACVYSEALQGKKARRSLPVSTTSGSEGPFRVALSSIHATV